MSNKSGKYVFITCREPSQFLSQSWAVWLSWTARHTLRHYCCCRPPKANNTTQHKQHRLHAERLMHPVLNFSSNPVLSWWDSQIQVLSQSWAVWLRWTARHTLWNYSCGRPPEANNTTQTTQKLVQLLYFPIKSCPSECLCGQCTMWTLQKVLQ